MNKAVEATRLLTAKAEEYGLHVAVEHILTAVTHTQREIEMIQKTPQNERRSIHTELLREHYQQERKEIDQELSALADFCNCRHDE